MRKSVYCTYCNCRNQLKLYDHWINMFKSVHYKIFEIIILILVYILALQQLMAWSHFNHYCHQIYVENEKSIYFFHFDWATSCSFGICFGFYICFCNWSLWLCWIILGNNTFKGNTEKLYMYTIYLGTYFANCFRFFRAFLGACFIKTVALTAMFELVWSDSKRNS